MKPRCRECGDMKPLNDLGVCKWRHGCEHRQYVHEATMARLEAEMDALDWHRQAAEKNLRFFEHYRSHPPRHPSQFRPPIDRPERMNRWIDDWLNNPDGDEGDGYA